MRPNSTTEAFVDAVFADLTESVREILVQAATESTCALIRATCTSRARSIAQMCGLGVDHADLVTASFLRTLNLEFTSRHVPFRRLEAWTPAMGPWTEYLRRVR